MNSPFAASFFRVFFAGLILGGCGPQSFPANFFAVAEPEVQFASPALVHFRDSISGPSFRADAGLFSAGAWNDPYLSSQWYFYNSGQDVPASGRGLAGADIRLPEGDSFPSVASPVILALIDTGVDRSHSDLNQDMYFVNRGETGLDALGRDKAFNGVDDDGNGFADDVHGWSFADDSKVQNDSLGHGTHLAGLLSAKSDNGKGIFAPWSGFRILPVQIFSGSHPSVPAQKIAGAIRYAVDSGAKVISASFGTPHFSQELYDAVVYAMVKDVLFVSAVGNFRKNLNEEPSYPASFGLENQIAAAAADSWDLAADFTNFGHVVDVFAPGVQIFSTLPRDQYGFRSGTSQACPLVAAVAAQIRAQYSGKSAVQVKSQILNAADEKSGLTGFSPTGRRLNAKNAIAGLTGDRLRLADETRSRTVSYTIESEHPYRSRTEVRIPLQLDADVAGFRLHFEKFVTHSADTLTIRNSSGVPVQRLSGSLGVFWSALIEGSAATVEFTSDAYVSDWGWKVDRIELIPR